MCEEILRDADGGWPQGKAHFTAWMGLEQTARKCDWRYVIDFTMTPGKIAQKWP